MSGMTCTRCFRPAGEAPDMFQLDAASIAEVCKRWLCDACLDDDDRASTPPSTGAEK